MFGFDGRKSGICRAAALAAAALAALLPGRGLRPADPAITEFLAANKSGLTDEDGETSDWIELHCPGPGEADLEGWHLTDDPGLLAKWRFPAVKIAPGGYLVVFASGKDRSQPESELHTSFKIESGGEYLALVRTDGTTIAQEFAPAFPPQRDDVSYGASLDVAVGGLVPAGAAARFVVPADDSIGLSWTGAAGDEPFDDSSEAGWTEGPTGIGFDLASDDIPPILYLDFNDASDPAAARDSSGLGHDGIVTSHLDFTGSGGGARPAYTADGGGHSGTSGDKALDFGLRGDGAMVTIPSAASGALDEATANDAITISLWAFGSADQPANDVIFWGSSNADGTGIRSLNAHIPWSDSVIYWDTSGCCDESQRVSKPEPDATQWKGRWNHYAFVKDGDTKRIYLNGELFLEGENTADLTPIRGFFIGCAPRSGEMSYGGIVDDLAVWDRALTAGQVAALARGASPLSLSSLAPFIETTVAGAMLDRSASAYVRIPFQAPEIGDANALILRVRYEDGFIAWLNGVEAARRNAPEDARFDSRAAGPRSRQEALEPEEIDLTAFLGLLRPGKNILAIQGLNESPSSRDFLLLPELLLGKTAPDRYLRPPTPGRPNARGVLGFVEEVIFSQERGYREAPFSVELSCATDGAAIHYTTDGSEPVPGAAGTEEYGAPIQVAKTTCLRAAAFKEGHEPSAITTHTYIFPASVAAQPALPQGLPSTWSGNYPADYQVDPDVVRSALSGHELRDALLSIPAVSITLPKDDLWGPANGIYYNSMQVWERAASVELIHPDGTRGFQVGAGVRIHGYTSRMNDFTPKHSFRVLFKSKYGPSKLEYSLFPDSDVRRFDQLVLRGMSTDSWPVMDGWDGPEPGAKRWFRERSTYLRETWMKDSQLDMGHLSCHAIFVHVYLNGLYWGLYSLTERPTDSFHAEHLGGEKEEYDVLKDFAEVQSGDSRAWNEMMALAAAGLSSAQAYQRIQGNDPDGTRNPAYPRLLDLQNLIDYMILHIYASADDWPNHNWWTGRRRGDESEGFKFFPWDQEITNMDLAYAHTSWGPRYEEVGAANTPSYLYAQLRANSEFRLRFADRVQKHLSGGGALTPEGSAARITRRAEEIGKAIVAESARWGDSKRAIPFKREVEWLAELDRLRDDYWPRLHPIAIERFRRVGLYPTVEAPALSPHGGTISPGFEIRISAPAGTVYFTLDGSDPRAPSGSPSPAARIAGAEPAVLGGTTTVKARALSGAKWSALTEAFFQVDVPLRITEIMYHPADPAPGLALRDEDIEFIEFQNVGSAPLSLAGIRLHGAVRFGFPEGAATTLAPGKLVLVVRDIGAFTAAYGTRGLTIAGEYEGELHNAGERIVLEGPAGELLHDFRYSDFWYPETDGGGFSLVIRDPSAAASTWAQRSSWRPSDSQGGSPGIDENAPQGGLQRPGDFNQDAVLNISDPVAFLTYLFTDASAGLPCEGSLEEGGNVLLLDSNGDSRVDLSDAVRILSYLFLGGPPHPLGAACAPILGCRPACD